jgi:hypothetical protein
MSRCSSFLRILVAISGWTEHAAQFASVRCDGACRLVVCGLILFFAVMDKQRLRLAKGALPPNSQAVSLQGTRQTLPANASARKPS